MIPSPARPASAQDALRFRERYREEMNCQIVHDSIHSRPGWTLTYLLEVDGVAVGYGSVAISGPWKDTPTILEFYVLPEHRTSAFDLFEALLAAGGAGRIEIQSNDALFAVMLHTYARDVVSEKIVFRDQVTTALPSAGSTILCLTPDDQTQKHIAHRQGGPEWRLELDGQPVGQGGILFHYNRPYGDIWMEVTEPFRRRGLGSYLVQQLKQAAYALGAIPCARCDPTNIPSRRTLQKAGFVPFAHMLTGIIAR